MYASKHVLDSNTTESPILNYRGIITNIVEENLRLLCSRKSERGLRRVGVVAREWGNMVKHYTVHKAVVACVSGENEHELQ